MTHEIKITLNDGDATQSRFIIECNGHELDILADADGIVATLQTLGGVVITQLTHDWNETHINA